MATKYYDGGSLTTPSTKKVIVYVYADVINEWVQNNIPAYSIINSVKVTCGCRKSTSIGYGTLEFKVAGNSIFTASNDINSTSDYSVNQEIKNYVQSGTDKAGQISGDIEFHFTCARSVTWSVKNCNVTFDYTEPANYTIATGVTPSGAGSCTGAGTYIHGSTATLTATPAAGYKFKQWSDGNTDNPRTITVTSNAALNAVFEKTTYTISTSVTPSGTGTVTGAGTYEYGSKATLTATPATGYKFKQWNDGSTNASRTITVTGTATYTATFEKLTYTISTNVSPSGSGTVTGGGTYEHGSTATLTATPATGYKFVKWNDGVTTATRTVTVTAAATYTATFENAYIPVYVKTSQCQAVYIDEASKTIYFYGSISFDTDEGGFDTVDGWHFKATRTIPTGTNIKLVEKIYIGTTRIL